MLDPAKVQEVKSGDVAVSVCSASKSFLRPARAEAKSILRRMFLQKKEKVDAVHDISFDVKKGEIVGLLGPNGAGKSTVLKLVMGMLSSSGGTIRVLGKNPSKDRIQICRLLGVMFGQRSHLIAGLPALHSLVYLGRMYDLSTNAAKARIEELSERFEVASYLHVPVDKLSLGERIRCELVATLLHQPKLVILDEPTLGLDVSAKIRFRKLLQEMAKQDDMTVLLTSHDVGDLDICSRVILINRGRLVTDTSLSDLRKAEETSTLHAAYCQTIDDTLVDQLRQRLGVTRAETSPDGASISVVLKVSALTPILTELVRWPSFLTIRIEQESLEAVLGRIYQNIESRQKSPR